MVFLFFRKFLIQFFKLFIKKASARTPAGTEDVKAHQKKVSPLTIGNCSLPHGNTTPSAQAYVPKEYDRSPDLGYRGPPSPRRAPFSGCLPNGFWRPFFRYSNGCCSGFTPDSLLSSGHRVIKSRCVLRIIFCAFIYQAQGCLPHTALRLYNNRREISTCFFRFLIDRKNVFSPVLFFIMQTYH